MSKVLVVLETADGKLRSHCLPGVTCAAQLAKARGAELHLLVLGANPSAAAATIAQAGYGATAVHTLAHPALEPFTAEAWSDAILQAVKTLGATAIGGAASSTLRDVLPRVAALLDAPLFSEVVAVSSGDTFVRPVSAGRALSSEKANQELLLFTARASEFTPAVADAPVAVQEIAPGEIRTLGVSVLKIEKTVSSRPSLSEAKIVVSGGRGMRESANFKVLEELTDLLGGALGASRAATDAGMVPADLQVGQTGKIVAPKLYIAVGISGAIQHLAGMKSSKTIVAINKDPEAPIFQVADYGLVAKWEDVVPQLIAGIKARKGL